MALSRDLSEFIAGLTWPLRGRKAVKEVERKIQEDLRVLRWEELHTVRSQIEQMRSETAHLTKTLKSDVATLAHQLDAFRQMHDRHFEAQQSHLQTQQNYLQALEKLMRGNFSHLHDRIATFQESENAVKKDLSAALDKVAALHKASDLPR